LYRIGILSFAPIFPNTLSYLFKKWRSGILSYLFGLKKKIGVLPGKARNTPLVNLRSTFGFFLRHKKGWGNIKIIKSVAIKKGEYSL
jgi:hypothetical protein